MRFEKPPVLIARAGGEKKMQTYLAPNKIASIKKKNSAQMCLRFVSWLCFIMGQLSVVQ